MRTSVISKVCRSGYDLGVSNNLWHIKVIINAKKLAESF